MSTRRVKKERKRDHEHQAPAPNESSDESSSNTLIPIVDESQSSTTSAGDTLLSEEQTLNDQSGETLVPMIQSNVLLVLVGNKPTSNNTRLMDMYPNYIWVSESNLCNVSDGHCFESTEIILVVNDEYHTHHSKKSLRGLISRFSSSLAQSSDVDVILLHRSRDECQRLKDSSIADVMVGTKPKYSGAFVLHRRSLGLLQCFDMNNPGSTSKVGCFNIGVFTQINPDATEVTCDNSAGSCLDPKISSWAIYAMAAVIVILLIVIFLIMICRKPSTPVVV